MKPLLPLAGLLLALGGCSQIPEPSLQPSRLSEPMMAQILPRSPGAGLRIRVDRPAYAALYQIIPGAGVSQVYPALGTGNMEGRVFAGYTSMNPVRFANLEDYAPSPLQANGPRFYFLITSDRPLDIGRFGTFGVGLRRELGLQFTGFNAYETMERIAEMTIPVPGDEESWSTDLYVEWPNVLFNAPIPGRTLVPLRCGDYRMYVPIDRVLEVDTRVCHPERIKSDAPQAPQPPTDSAVTARPRPRPPVPPTSKPASPKAAEQRAASRALRERIMASAQLDEPRDDTRGTPRDRPALGRSAEGRARARPGRESDPSGANRGVRYGGSRGSSAGVDAAATRTVESASGQTSSSGARSPQPAASPAPAPAAAPAPAPRPTPEARGDSNGG